MADEETLCALPNIGKKKAKSLIDAFNLPFHPKRKINKPAAILEREKVQGSITDNTQNTNTI